MDSDLLAEINLFAKEVATKIQRVVPCKKIGVSVVGLEVPHAHMHLIPLNTIKDMSFTGERLKLTQEEFEILAKKIREA
jgi:histidine triad (HIT) family protein